jgi:hypothetical protein
MSGIPIGAQLGLLAAAAYAVVALGAWWLIRDDLDPLRGEREDQPTTDGEPVDPNREK